MVTNLACRALLQCASKRLIPPSFLAFPPLTSIPQLPYARRTISNGWRHQSTSLASSTIKDLEQSFAKAEEAHSLIKSLELAVAHRDILSVCGLSESLLAKGMSDKIGSVAISKIHNLVYGELFERKSKLEPEKLEFLSILCAANGKTDALAHVMSEYLRKGEAPSVIKAYAKLEGMSSSQSESVVSKGVDLVGDSEGKNDKDLLALVVAAHACCGTFEDALHTVLRIPSPRLPVYRMPRIAKDLNLPHNIRGWVLKYTSALEMAYLVSHPVAFRGRVRNLTEPRSEAKLQNVCLQLVAGFEGELPWATTDESRVSRSRPVFVQDIIWASLIRALVVCRNDDLAGRLWSKMSALGVKPTVAVWHALLDGYRETQQFARLLSAWDSMIQSKLRPDAALHCSRILALFDSGSKSQAMEAFEEFKRDMQDIPGGALVVYNSTIRGLLKAHDVDGANAVLKTMSTDSLRPDIVTFNTFIQHHARKGDMQSILTTIRDLSATGIAPDVVTFTTLHVALFKAGQAKATETLLKIMEQMGIEPNVTTYSAMIDQYVREGTSEGIRLGRELLEKMEMTPDARPNEITYTSFLMGLHRNSELSQEEVMDATEEILQRMERRSIRVKLGMYHTLLKGALSSSRPDDGLAAFQNYYRMMVKRNIKFAHDTWYIILSGLIRRNEWGLAKVMVDDMLGSGFQPMWGVQDMVRSVLQRKITSSSSRRDANRRPFV